MCGIVGYAGRTTALDERAVIAMRDALAHRGPDTAGVWSSPNGTVVLGHRRLSILDLSPTGAQPMISDDGNLAIVFNGEIYNHHELRTEIAASGGAFRGRSDTEALLGAYRLWGERCVSKLRGMFAFAIYDLRRGTLFLARDRAGEKPLYWAPFRGGIIFASELKALMALQEFPRRICTDALAFYLTYGYAPGERCLLAGVNKLPPAHYMKWSIDSGHAATSRYWDIPKPIPATNEHRQSLVDELQHLLTEAVREQLVADVPVGVLLSGGIDSSIVTAIAVRASRHRVRTFTVGVPGHSRFDESVYARRIASHFQTDHVELSVDETSIDLIEALARQYDEPIGDSSMIPTFLLAGTVSRQCKVVLGGDGGDELFGGYKMYQGLVSQDWLRRAVPSPVRTAISWCAEAFLPNGMPNRNGLIGLRGGLAAGVARIGVLFNSNDFPWLSGQSSRGGPISWREDLVELCRGMPGAAMATDFRSYLPDDILVKVDRASMAYSLEVRAPMLDYRIVEFAYRDVPNTLRASRTERKILLKDLARRILPEDFDVDRKQGFSIPLASWLTRETVKNWQEQCREQIDSVFSRRNVELGNMHSNEGMHHRLYALMMLTWWMRHYQIAV